jgi:hypothetical protein
VGADTIRIGPCISAEVHNTCAEDTSTIRLTCNLHNDRRYRQLVRSRGIEQVSEALALRSSTFKKFMSLDNPEYDVAISFLAKDEAIAEAFYRGLSETLNVFYYPKNQEGV